MVSGGSLSLPAQSELHRLLCYDPDTGLFTWRARGISKFDSRFAGKPAFASTWNGYRVGSLLGKQRSAHRVAFKYVYGHDPANEIDHINGDRSDNRIVNLRDVTTSTNRRNAAAPRTNTSGRIGVGYRADKNKWRAHSHGSHLGYFETKREAVSAREAYEQVNGYGPNHGRLK